MSFVQQEMHIESIKDITLIFGLIVLLFLIMPIGVIRLLCIWFEPNIAMQLFMIIHIFTIVFIMSRVMDLN